MFIFNGIKKYFKKLDTTDSRLERSFLFSVFGFLGFFWNNYLKQKRPPFREAFELNMTILNSLKVRVSFHYVPNLPLIE
jgi:hypothetical protein